MLPRSLQMPAAGIVLVGGLLSCFFGYRLFRIVLAIYGFLVGAFLGNSLVGATELVPSLLAALGGGVVGAIVSVVGYYAGVSLLGAGGGAAAVVIVSAQMEREPALVALIVVSVLGAFAALVLQRYVIVLTTAFGGAWSLLMGVIALVEGVGLDNLRGDAWLALPTTASHGTLWVLLAWVVLGVFGTVVQLRTTGSRR